MKIEIKPITIEDLKMYKEKSPSKYEAKFGNLDLDNIPQEYMKTRKVQVGEREWKDEEYFDSVQYRQDVLSGKPKTPLIEGLTTMPKIQVDMKPVEAPVIKNSHIGDELGDGDEISDEIEGDIDGGEILANKRK